METAGYEDARIGKRALSPIKRPSGLTCADIAGHPSANTQVSPYPRGLYVLQSPDWGAAPKEISRNPDMSGALLRTRYETLEVGGGAA